MTAIAEEPRVDKHPQAFSISVSGNASTRIGKPGRTPNTIAANAATAPAASVHISHPKAEVRQPSTRPTSVLAECTEAVVGGMLTELSKGADRKGDCPMIDQHPC